ncbi:MAG TPA: choice-of-anchor D domain-containing protein, partial [Anaeromyxobacteraceae bacterium]|nr:choice-of-anchor D domain-containing protein [Anaeromyxobacteraceae bacterium]
FLDTMLVNGTAYPTVNVDPTAYRFHLLNASQERNLNLSLFVADATGTEVPMVPAVPHTATSALPLCKAGAAVDPATRLPKGCWPQRWPVDNRYGGVPDPLAAGPAIVQIGSESGILPAPAVIPAQPVNYEYNRRNVVVLNVSDKALFMGPAERADVVVDFSAWAGKTLILYNDSPAPVPGFDVRLDYFTGDYDQTSTGGAPSTLPGYGPNTRTIMQIKVNAVAAAPAPAFSPTAAAAALAARFAASQPPPIVPEAVFNPVYGKTFANTYSTLQANQLTFTPVCASTTPATCPAGAVTLPMGQKAIQELFDTDYGRMNATLGVEMPMSNFLQQTTIPYANFDPVTEFLTDGKPQLWKITHNGVDTHTIHFHLLNVQVVNRVGWDGQIRPPDANELGWKESVRMHPLEIIYVALLPVRQKLPWPIPDQIRPLDVTRPLGTTAQFTGVDTQNRPVTVSNDLTNFGWEYVWHCHLLGHEEADMLRAEIFITAPEDPTDLSAVASATPGQALLTWTDASRSAQSFTIERDTSPFFTAPTTFAVAAPKVQPGPVSFTDTAATSGFYFYRVKGTKAFSSQAEPGTTYTSSSGWSAVAQLGNAPKAVVAPASLAFGNQLVGSASAAQTVTLTNAGSGDLAIASIALGGASAADFATTSTCGATLAPGAACTVDVTFAPAGTGAKAATLGFTTNDPYNPTASVALAGTGVAPAAAVSPASLAFGDQLVTTASAAQAVTLSNTGTANLAVASLALAGADAAQFTLVNGCGATVAPGASCAVSVAFAPATIGAKAASVVVTSNDPANPTLTVGLTGNGVIATASVSPASLAFGNKQVGTSTAAGTVTLSNTGTTALAIGSIAFTGANPGDFAQTSTCGASVPAAGSCTVSVTFKPTAPGPRAASLSIATNDPVNPVVSVVVSGTGLSVTLTPSLPSPQLAGTAVTFTAVGQGASGYRYAFWLLAPGAAAFTKVQDYDVGSSWTLPATSTPGTYQVVVHMNTVPGTLAPEARAQVAFTIVNAGATG